MDTCAATVFCVYSLGPHAAQRHSSSDSIIDTRLHTVQDTYTHLRFRSWTEGAGRPPRQSDRSARCRVSLLRSSPQTTSQPVRRTIQAQREELMSRTERNRAYCAINERKNERSRAEGSGHTAKPKDEPRSQRNPSAGCSPSAAPAPPSRASAGS